MSEENEVRDPDEKGRCPCGLKRWSANFLRCRVVYRVLTGAEEGRREGCSGCWWKVPGDYDVVNGVWRSSALPTTILCQVNLGARLH